uniref:Serine-threonine/tyrosine-protein kinase catalytic domain-containing protein n=1 Tax=Oncorhynchus tshawytscha TaxID=74940 RepID=A0AAZ3RQK9_ONCTS
MNSALQSYSIEDIKAWTSSSAPETMTQPTSRLCKGYLTKKESDGVLHQMTWPPQSPNLYPIEMVWDELDRRVNEKQPTSAQHMWELLQDCWKSIPHEAG